MLVVLVPWLLSALLWWEARQLNRQIEQAMHDRS